MALAIGLRPSSVGGMPMPHRAADALAETPQSPEAIQELVARAVSAFSAAVEDDAALSPLATDHGLTETDILRCVSALLATAEIELFELAVWRLWAHR